MPTIQEWLSTFKDATAKTYRSALFNFLDFVNGSPVRTGYATTESKEQYEVIAAEYLKGEDFGKDVEGFVRTLKDTPPKTAQVYIAAIRDWLIYNRVQLSDFDKHQIKKQMPKGGAVSFEAELDHEKIRLILAHADSTWIRAIILMLASSGMRINELLSLTHDDVERKGKCWRVKIQGKNTKTREKRYTFISSEAAAAFQAWERGRPQYLKASRGFCNGKDKSEDDRIFPMSDENVRSAFNGILKKAGIYAQDKDTNRSDLTPHSFRKFFLSQIKIKMPAPVAELLVGHRGYLDDAYSRYGVAQVCELYNKAEAMVTIQAPASLIQIETNFDERMNGYSTVIESLVKENVELKNRVEKVEALLETLKNLESQPEYKEILRRIEQLESRK